MNSILASKPLTTRVHVQAVQDDSGTIWVEVVKTSNGQPIPDDEPCFLLRARDVLAVPLLMCYRALIRAAWYPNPDAKQEHLDTNTTAIEAFEAFAKTQPEKMKLPNITRGK